MSCPLVELYIYYPPHVSSLRFGGLICSLISFLQLNMCQELQIFAVVYMYWGAGCLVRLCGSDFGLTPADDIREFCQMSCHATNGSKIYAKTYAYFMKHSPS